VAGALALAIAVSLTGISSSRDATVSESPRDKFGVSKLYLSPEDGMKWEANWEGGELGWSEDPWVWITGSRDLRYRNADGVLTISGETSRFYVRDPNEQRQWRDIEVTVYGKRIADEGLSYSGLVTAVRTNHGVTSRIEDAPCDSRGLTARLRFDGSADFGKETLHPTTIATDSIRAFSGGLPYNEWIGYKHVVYDIKDAAGVAGTRQELWMDLTGGKNGGTWRMVASHDDFPYSGFGRVPCAPGISPSLAYVNGERAGSETGLPSIAVLFRADSIGYNGLQYKWASVREINKSYEMKRDDSDDRE
jgi:hypothetical protein